MIAVYKVLNGMEKKWTRNIQHGIQETQEAIEGR